MARRVANNASGKYLRMNDEQVAREQAKFDAAVAALAARLGHCTTLTFHNPLCDRDGHYCSLESTHKGPCKPHGTAK